MTRFAWGDTSPGCQQHPEGKGSFFSPGSMTSCALNDDPLRAFSVGQHPAGAGSSGIEDVLLSPGELIDVSMDAYTMACVAPFAACVAYGVVPAAIDGFEPVTAGETAAANKAYSFRCVWN
ncbi:hypothetical protein LZC95_49755 [Pendulispora brunnea]|uniref:Uncharacterized protein n=1 Tax=Pendulispora brunnea TaxID=2905690 RepID=A0ABZ2K8V7_9BACT